MSYIIESDYSEIFFENELLKYKEEQFKKNNLDKEFPNVLLKEDVLNILEKFSTVIYYPLVGEKNNGFHIDDIPYVNERKNLVFINTAQTIEKQVFTAAHELGHIWGVDEYVITKFGINDSREQRERIINRFAAVLLMPMESFKSHYDNERNKYSKGSISLLDMFKIIVSLMNCFFVPRKSVIYRLVELEIISVGPVFSLLLGEGNVSENAIDIVVKKLLQDNGCDKFLKASERKWIEGLSDLLDKSEQEQSVPDSIIEKMRDLFELKNTAIPNQMDEKVDIP